MRRRVVLLKKGRRRDGAKNNEKKETCDENATERRTVPRRRVGERANDERTNETWRRDFFQSPKAKRWRRFAWRIDPGDVISRGFCLTDTKHRNTAEQLAVQVGFFKYIAIYDPQKPCAEPCQLIYNMTTQTTAANDRNPFFSEFETFRFCQCGDIPFIAGFHISRLPPQETRIQYPHPSLRFPASDENR